MARNSLYVIYESRKGDIKVVQEMSWKDGRSRGGRDRMEPASWAMNGITLRRVGGGGAFSD